MHRSKRHGHSITSSARASDKLTGDLGNAFEAAEIGGREVKRTSRSRAVDPMLRPYHGRLQERTMDRRLAAILAADVAGYSRLMSEDETGTLAAFQAHRSEVIMPTIERHRGRIVRLMGDGILAEFGSVVEAVACATEVQHQMEVRNRGAPAPTLFSESSFFTSVPVGGQLGVNLKTAASLGVSLSDVFIARANEVRE
jgi:class 3 adenylate cyclase